MSKWTEWVASSWHLSFKLRRESRRVAFCQALANSSGMAGCRLSVQTLFLACVLSWGAWLSSIDSANQGMTKANTPYKFIFNLVLLLSVILSEKLLKRFFFSDFFHTKGLSTLPNLQPTFCFVRFCVPLVVIRTLISSYLSAWPSHSARLAFFISGWLCSLSFTIISFYGLYTFVSRA